ncbi:hypothetical protein C2W62_25680 [Candidatus Entotheonella serta]|nr:hypothetical protein C2W62_25680 [Candidatus Entotheonella serta]
MFSFLLNIVNFVANYPYGWIAESMMIHNMSGRHPHGPPDQPPRRKADERHSEGNVTCDIMRWLLGCEWEYKVSFE